VRYVYRQGGMSGALYECEKDEADYMLAPVDSPAYIIGDKAAAAKRVENIVAFIMGEAAFGMTSEAYLRNIDTIVDEAFRVGLVEIGDTDG
jgi:hypothetical protein